MSYAQFGYTYPPSSQLLMTGNHPATATPCCQPASPVEPYVSGGAPQPTPAAAAAVCSLPAAYDSRLLSSFPRLAGLYASSAASATAYADPQGYVTAALAGTNPSAAFYSTLTNPYELKESRGAWAPLSQGTTTACYPYDPTGVVAYGPYGDRYGSMDSVARRKNATRETTNTLKAWLYEHRKNPYPTKGEKIMLAIITKMTLTQVSTWFANARRRLKKENKMTWEPRNKSGDAADTEDNGSSPSLPGSELDCKKSVEDNLNDDDSGDLRVKPEVSNNANSDDRTKPTEFGPCTVKSETTTLGPSGCFSLNLGQTYSIPRPPTLTACSPQTDYQSHSPVSPDQRLPILHHHHSIPFDERNSAFILRPGSSPLCDGGDLLDDRPKIWSLAHTATSDSPPNLKRAHEEYGSPKSSPPGAPTTTPGYSCGGRGSSHRPLEDGDVSRRWMNGDCCAAEGTKGQYGYPLRRYGEAKTISDCYQSQPVFESCLSPQGAYKQNDSFSGSCGELPSRSTSSSSSPSPAATTYLQRPLLQRKPYVNDERNTMFDSCDRRAVQNQVKPVQADAGDLLNATETVGIPVQSCMAVIR